MSPVARRLNKTTQMSITSLIDILTILLLFILVNVSSSPDRIPEGIILEEALFDEKIPENSILISLNVSYTGNDTGVITYKSEETNEQIIIAKLEELNNTTTDLMMIKTSALDATINSIIGNNIGDKLVVVRVKAHKNTPVKYVNTIKSMLIDIWNDDNSKVKSLSRADEFKLYFATELVQSETKDYYRVLSAYGLGGL